MKVFCLLTTIFLIIFSCKPKKEGLYAYSLETKLPIKCILGETRNDSTIVYLMIPQKVRFENALKTDLRLRDIHFTLEGGASHNYTHGVVYEFKNDSLQDIYYEKKNIPSHSKETFSLYVRYKAVALKEQLGMITKDTVYDQMYLKRPMYNTYSVEQDNLKYYLIPLEKRGYIRFALYNIETDKGEDKVIPVQF